MGVINNNVFGLIKGDNGATPEIGENGNWWIDGVDTGKPSRGATGETGATGANGQDGADGLGVPAGGTTGQVLTKVSDADNDTSWQDLKGGRSVDITQYRQNNKFIFPVNIINECVKEFLNGCSVVFVDKNDEDKPTSYKMISATQDGSGYENIYIFTLETYSKKGEVPVVAKSVYFPTEETYHIDAIADLSGGGLDGASFLGNGMTRICVYDDRTIAEEAQKASYDGQSRKIDETYYVKPEGGIPKTDLSAEVTDEITPLVATDQLTYSENEYNINHAFLPLKTSFNRTPIQDEIFNAVLNVTDVNGDYLHAAQAVVQVYNANYDLDHVECRVISKYRISGQDGADGTDGATFTPSVDAAGNLSWTNDGGKENPPTVNIKGEKGDKGDTGAQGIQGEKGDKGDKGDTGAQGAQGIQGEKGDKGDTGAAGANGADGATPEIGANGNWWINGEDTGKPSRGADGAAGADGYISSKKAKIQSYKWIPTTWNGFTDFYGTYIWTDGENIYYSSGANQYVLDRATSTWTEKTWNGLTNFYGQDVWTDGENIYYSLGANQYVLDRATSTWRVKIWNGLTNMSGRQLWTDGENIYHSNEAVQYVLDRATSTWTKKTWNGLTYFSGELCLWTDGENIYHSDAGQYVLDRATSTWRVKIWNGLTNLTGAYVWTDGENIYYSAGADQYVLDRATSTWTEKTWNGFTNFYAGVIWTDGENIYLSSGATKQYVLSPVIASSKPFIKR